MHQHYLASEESFEHFFENILKAPSVAALAQYDLERRTAVAIWAENGRVYGELRHVRDDGSHIAVKGSRLACLD